MGRQFKLNPNPRCPACNAVYRGTDGHCPRCKSGVSAEAEVGLSIATDEEPRAADCDAWERGTDVTITPETAGGGAVATDGGEPE